MRSLMKKMEHQDRIIADQVVNRETELLTQQRADAVKVDETEQKRLAIARELQATYQGLWRAQNQADLNLQFMILALVVGFISMGALVYFLGG